LPDRQAWAGRIGKKIDVQRRRSCGPIQPGVNFFAHARNLLCINGRPSHALSSGTRSIRNIIQVFGVWRRRPCRLGCLKFGPNSENEIIAGQQCVPWGRAGNSSQGGGGNHRSAAQVDLAAAAAVSRRDGNII
jgi:hypothetical protein